MTFLWLRRVATTLRQHPLGVVPNVYRLWSLTRLHSAGIGCGVRRFILLLSKACASSVGVLMGRGRCKSGSAAHALRQMWWSLSHLLTQVFWIAFLWDWSCHVGSRKVDCAFFMIGTSSVTGWEVCLNGALWAWHSMPKMFHFWRFARVWRVLHLCCIRTSWSVLALFLVPVCERAAERGQKMVDQVVCWKSGWEETCGHKPFQSGLLSLLVQFVDRAPIRGTHLCSTVCFTSAERTHNALGSRIALSSFCASN